MGFLAGVVAEINRQEDAKTRADEFMMELLERRKNQIIPELQERIEKRTEKANQAVARVELAHSLGLSKEAAAVLERSGQLSFELEQLSKLGSKNLNREWLNTLSEHIVESVEPDKAAAALKYVLQGDLSGRESMNRTLVNALWNAESAEEFNIGITDAMSNMTEGSGPSIMPVEYSSRGAGIVTPSERSSIQNTIAKSMANTLGVQLQFSPNGEYVGFQGEDQGAAQEILNNAYDIFLEVNNDPSFLGDPQSVINPLVDRMRILQANGIPLNEIAQNKYFEITETNQEPGDTGGSENLLDDLTGSRDPLDEILNGGRG
jgi:hypothetical protein